MTQVAQMKVALNGWFGAPGVNVWNFCGPFHASIGEEAVRDFAEILATSYDSLTALWAEGVTFTIPSEVSIFDAATGELLDIVTTGDPLPITPGGGPGSESRATQVLYQLHTSDIRNNRRVQGRIFLGPASSDVIGDDGLLDSSVGPAVIDAFSGAIDPLSARAVVWSRPTGAVPSGGQVSDVQSATVRDRPGTLRGRNR